MYAISSRKTIFPPHFCDQSTMNKADLIWWPDDKKGVIINAVAARDRATPLFVFTRAIRLLFPMPIMVLASYVTSTTLTFPDDSPGWILTWIEWGPTTLAWACSAMTVFVISMLLIDWRRDRSAAVALEREASALGVDIANLDGDWVFEALVLPMVRRKGVTLPDDSVAHLREE